MCGICGYFGLLDGQSVISDMTETLYLRGPDDSGTYIFRDDRVAFGHRRLSILDLSSAGHQPMLNNNKNIGLTYNGEVYNFLELRQELQEKGRRFQSRTDTEVILACYEQYGIEMVSRLDGIFAFAIFDSVKKKIYLVRDHIGVKPLYYSLVNGKLFFGSEIKAILAANQVTPEVNKQALFDYLTYLYVPCPLTMYKGILQVPPAHILTLDLNSNEHTLKRYWDPRDKNDVKLSDPIEISEIVHTTLDKTVKEQLISDVPVGAFLSGGIDSNIVVSLMAKYSPQRVNTFTAIFSDDNASYFNEREAAARVAKKFNTSHIELEIPTPTIEDMFTMLSWTDQPFGNPTLFLSYLISKEIRKTVTVALSGAGGDELFGGYTRYQHFSFARNLINRLPFNLAGAANSIVRLWPPTIKPELRRRAYKFFHGLVPDIAQHYQRWAYFLDDSHKKRIINGPSEFLESSRILQKLFNESRGFDDVLNSLEYVDLKSYLVDDILEYTDKSSMAASLEVRVPFLSPKMVELSFRIPGERKIRHGQTKIPLRHAFSECFPKENLKAPKKGFSAPLQMWGKDLDRYFDLAESKLPSECPLNLYEIKKLRSEHQSGRFNHGQILFSILMLEIWLFKAIYS
jgi:asparagine synthase (glutamine-hydrolysing)